eukprot:3407444-Amphidinium_carterae.1
MESYMGIGMMERQSRRKNHEGGNEATRYSSPRESTREEEVAREEAVLCFPVWGPLVGIGNPGRPSQVPAEGGRDRIFTKFSQLC